MSDPVEVKWWADVLRVGLPTLGAVLAAFVGARQGRRSQTEQRKGTTVDRAYNNANEIASEIDNLGYAIKTDSDSSADYFAVLHNLHMRIASDTALVDLSMQAQLLFAFATVSVLLSRVSARGDKDRIDEQFENLRQFVQGVRTKYRAYFDAK